MLVTASRSTNCRVVSSESYVVSVYVLVGDGLPHAALGGCTVHPGYNPHVHAAMRAHVSCSCRTTRAATYESRV